MRAITKYEFRFKLGSPSSILPDQLFLVKMSDTTDIAERSRQSGIGTGPYKVVELRPRSEPVARPEPELLRAEAVHQARSRSCASRIRPRW